MAKKIIGAESHQFSDPNLKPAYWWNKDNAQVHIFKSILHTAYPFEKDQAPKIFAKPGRVTEIPHKYYTINSRDGTPCRGAWVVGGEVESCSPESLSRGDAYGHED